MHPLGLSHVPQAVGRVRGARPRCPALRAATRRVTGGHEAPPRTHSPLGGDGRSAPCMHDGDGMGSGRVVSSAQPKGEAIGEALQARRRRRNFWIWCIVFTQKWSKFATLPALACDLLCVCGARGRPTPSAFVGCRPLGGRAAAAAADNGWPRS